MLNDGNLQFANWSANSNNIEWYNSPEEGSTIKKTGEGKDPFTPHRDTYSKAPHSRRVRGFVFFYLVS